MDDKNTQKNTVVISVKNVSKQFSIPHERISTISGAFVNMFKKNAHETFYALKDISFEVKRGEFFGILGRNGSGKSTLLKILAGVYTTDKGHVKIDGRVSPFLELGIGFNPELSGRDNIYLNATVLGLTKKEIDAKFDSIVAFSELERFIDQKLKNYSSGMQVRLAFAVSIHANREILLMDEVLAVGDANFQSKCLREFAKYKEQGKTVILVTHDIGTVQKYCDRAMLLREGKIVLVGSAEEVGNEYIYQNMSDEEKRIIKEQEQSKIKAEKDMAQAQMESEKQHQVEEQKHLEKERKRNSKIQITSCKFFNEQSQETTVLQSGKRFVIKLQAKFNIDAKEVAFGVMFRNGNDKDLFGFHSLYSENPLQIEEIKAGTEVEIIFDGQMLLNRGLYNIYIGIADNVKYPKFDLLYSEETGVYIEVTCSDILWGSIMNKYNTIYNKLK